MCARHALLTLAVALALGAPAADAGRQRRAAGVPIDHLAQELQLSPQQVAALEAIERERLTRVAELQARQQILRYDLDRQMAVEMPDEAAVMATIDALSEIRSEMMRAGYRSRLATRRAVGDKVGELLRLRSAAGRQPRRGHESPRAGAQPAFEDHASGSDR